MRTRELNLFLRTSCSSFLRSTYFLVRLSFSEQIILKCYFLLSSPLFLFLLDDVLNQRASHATVCIGGGTNYEDKQEIRAAGARLSLAPIFKAREYFLLFVREKTNAIDTMASDSQRHTSDIWVTCYWIFIKDRPGRNELVKRREHGDPAAVGRYTSRKSLEK